MSIYPALIELLARYVTGSLLTDSQIKSITSNIVGKYFNDFFPISQQEVDAENRISAARIHITEASKIINGLQDELEGQVLQLDALAKEIEDKRNLQKGTNY